MRKKVTKPRMDDQTTNSSAYLGSGRAALRSRRHVRPVLAHRPTEKEETVPHPLKISLVAAFTIVAASLGFVSSRAGAATTEYCGITWGSLAKHSGQGPGISPAPLTAVSAGQHPCFDRLVFQLNGPVAGYNLHYGPVLTEGQGLPLALRGGASLDIVLYAPANPSNVVNVSGFRTFRQVADGGSFEGYTTIGLGVRARLPFRVFTLPGPGHQSRIVVDVAHQW
jgi:hypothetical protein